MQQELIGHGTVPESSGSNIPLPVEISKTLSQLFIGIVKIDLENCSVLILQDSFEPKKLYQTFHWDEYLALIVSRSPRQKDKEILCSCLSSSELLNAFVEGRSVDEFDFQYDICGTVIWATVTTLFDTEKGKPYASLFILKSDKNHMLSEIVDLYVNSTCDYFICINAKNNSYTAFGHNNSGVPIPSADCEDYAHEIVKYAEKWVVPADRKKVIREMSMERVLDQLSNKEIHTLTCGINDPKRGYTRKRLEYRYYDREKQLLLLSRTDITDVYEEEMERQKEMQLALERAKTDASTGLLNKCNLEDRVSLALEHITGLYALMFLDLDNFKMVNDTQGHLIGDAVIQQVANVLKRETRHEDIVGRIGGDEFIIFLPSIRSKQDVMAYAQRLCDSIQNLEYLQTLKVTVSASIGIIISSERGMDYAALVERADAKVYEAKAKGKNCYAI